MMHLHEFSYLQKLDQHKKRKGPLLKMTCYNQDRDVVVICFGGLKLKLKNKK